MVINKYIKDFENLGFGLFVHFGIYSIFGKGEWIQSMHGIPKEKYEKAITNFKVKKNWAKELIKTAKNAGCKYITITTRHHDGFSLFDTKGLSTFDAPHSACGRDLIKEFYDECIKNEIVPFFYHTLLDWHNEDFETDFPKYIDYLIDSIEILCKNYGKIGGFWFDGMWSKPNENWQENRLYGVIRKYQPEAMIINNTGLSNCGKVGHYEIDSVTFERGKVFFVDNSDKYRAGEMCQVLNDHWGYAKNDCNYKSIKELIENLVDCRRYNCNFLLNTGLKGNGEVNLMDKSLLLEIGKWIKKNKNFIYNIKASDLTAENSDILTDGKNYYVVIKDVPMSADPNVTKSIAQKQIRINANLKGGEWLDDGKKIIIQDNCFDVVPFTYGTSLSVRVAKFKI